jgi:cruciform cutting endonuclease 1
MLDKQLLKSLKVARLKELLVAIGSKTAGTKDRLCRRLETDLHRPKIVEAAQHGKPSRVLSIDMGIRNLGLCVADVSFARSAAADRRTTARLRVSRWQRLTLVDAAAADPEEAEGGGGFSPPALSAVAARLVRDELLPLRASAALIERQRWRSGGRAAVAEWTLRVNALEAMLWAAFRALAAERGGGGEGRCPELHAVGPARVAAFWLPGLRRVDKRAKVELVRAGVAGGALGPVEVAFGEGAAEAARGFGGAGGRAKGRDAGGSGPPERRKLDDLADSLLQAAAWAAWEANRRSLLDGGIDEFSVPSVAAHVQVDGLSV